MPPNRPTDVRLTPKALGDLDGIWHYTARTWSPEQADAYIDELSLRFDMLSATPEMARERSEFDPPVRILPHRNHLIIYLIGDGRIDIIRILGGKQDWQAVLRVIDR
ncbi:toxin ParE1/3/4 [Hoeflea marina]|uniref:Toxin n=1 Tax=Hoeflea marina TaxID=274592 RepID=A0A317PQD2_9HYPH|nr:type II toxin-antitoxin system RelE/ParE family toxin [Hoeflea marina]PWW03672.1 toxin ParE1/3/4 [Hoeflea marina]